MRDRLLSRKGFREYRLYRFLGGENRYLRAEFWEDGEAAQAFWTDPDMREFSAKLPSGRGAPKFGYYEVLHQLGEARAATR